MDSEKLEELFLTAAEASDSAVIDTLADVLRDTENLTIAPFADNIVFLLESWGETVVGSKRKADFSIELTKQGAADTLALRNAVSQAIKHYLPEGYTKQGVLGVIGFRDEALPLSIALQRFDCLASLAEGMFVYELGSHSWWKVIEIDTIALAVGLSAIHDSNKQITELAPLLSNFCFFYPDRGLEPLLNPDKNNLPSAGQFNEALEKSSITSLTPDERRDICCIYWSRTHSTEPV